MSQKPITYKFLRRGFLESCCAFAFLPLVTISGLGIENDNDTEVIMKQYFGDALLPIDGSKARVEAYERIWKKLPDEKYYWLKQFSSELIAAKSESQLERIEFAINQLLQSSIGTNFQLFLDDFYKKTAEEDAFIELIYPHGTFIVGFADPEFLVNR
jgi:hypothetical protein